MGRCGVAWCGVVWCGVVWCLQELLHRLGADLQDDTNGPTTLTSHHPTANAAGENGNGGCPCKAGSDQDYTDLDVVDLDVHASTEGRLADRARYPALDDATTEPIFPPELALAKPRALHLRSAKVRWYV